ncbi:MAG: YaaC family protein [Devosia sp.]
MKLQDPRPGDVVSILKRPTPFSFFPTYQGTKREGLQSTLFATDPWNLISHTLEGLGDLVAKHQARAFWVQARDFYVAAQHSDVNAAKPLLLYYSFLNLAKCLVVKSSGAALGTVRHGLSEKLPTTPSAIHGHVSVDITANPQVSAFVMFANTLGSTLPQPVAPDTHIQVRSQDFLGQILIGHRIFCQAESITERFISLDRIDFMQNAATKEMWLRARAYADDFTRLNYNMTSLSQKLNQALTWRSVKCGMMVDGRRIIEAETTTAVVYGDRPSQVIGQLSSQARSRLWRSVTAYPPYRKYYIYQESATQLVMHQLLTIYLATFYFGSITRYKPEQFDDILRSPIGPFVFEFFANQPSQFLYLMASEFLRQEVARAAIA